MGLLHELKFTIRCVYLFSSPQILLSFIFNPTILTQKFTQYCTVQHVSSCWKSSNSREKIEFFYHLFKVYFFICYTSLYLAHFLLIFFFFYVCFIFFEIYWLKNCHFSNNKIWFTPCLVIRNIDEIKCYITQVKK